ncbi:MAG: RagB/SusD family nutrient uptake outer membrane protein [Sphingobacteriales bacterium]|nr:MAG: RagB/SusD family nutrient uptake outer membrane protein [Sphingobacteriales bacterium]
MKTFNIKNIGTALLLAATVTSSSCNKFLDETDPSNLTEETYFTLPGHADAAIAAAYAQTRFIGNGAGIFVQNFSLPEMLSGMARTETGQNSDLNNIVGLSYNGDNLLITQWWTGLYSVIAQANLVLKRVPEINPMDETAKKRVLAQAQFLRAWAYFYLVQMWGDVPLIIEPVESFASENLFPGRTPAAQVYDQIVADLIAAEGGSLPWTDNSGRASMGAVKGLLAKVYLTMAGFPMSKGATHYKLAADKANEVITNGSYKLFATYNELHSYATENRDEHMFMIQYLGGVADNPFQGQIVPNFKDISSLGTEVGSNVPVPNFVATYEAGDERTKDRVGMYYTSYYTEGYLNPLKPLGNPYIYKHFDVISNGTLGAKGTNVSSLNYPLMRYAEILLIYAEAQNEVDAAPSAAAWNAYKQIRDRAKLVTPAAGTFTKATFRDAVLRERWWELAFECITWYDMLRTRKAFNVTTKTFEPLVGHKFPDNGAQVQEKHLLLPLPTNEMKNNPNLTPNNPGY